MAAPTVTERQTPAGIYLREGYQTLIAFELAPTLSFWERTVGMPSQDGGDLIDVTTMHAVGSRIKRPRTLVDNGEFTTTGLMDPNLWNTVQSTLLNQEQMITEHLPDGSTLSYFGVIRLVEYPEFAEGESPEATMTVGITNWDPVNNVQANPVMVSAPGT